MKPLFATALTLIATSATLATTLSATEARVRLAEVTLERSALLNKGSQADLTIAPATSGAPLASAVDRLRLALGVELRGAGSIRRVTLVLPRTLGGTRQTLFASKTGGPSVQVDFRLRTGEKLRKFVARNGLALCRSRGAAKVTVDVPVDLAIVARKGRNKTFRLRRAIPVVVACPIAADPSEVAEKLGRPPALDTARDGDAPNVRLRQVGRPRSPLREPDQDLTPDRALEGVEQRARRVVPNAGHSSGAPPAVDTATAS